MSASDSAARIPVAPPAEPRAKPLRPEDAPEFRESWFGQAANDNADPPEDA